MKEINKTEQPKIKQTKKTTSLYNLSYLVLGGFFSILGFIVFTILSITTNPKELVQSPLLILIVEGMLNGLMFVLGYFYGSSKSEEEKN